MKYFLKLSKLIISFLFFIYFAPSVYATTYQQGPVLINPAQFALCDNTNFCTTAGGTCYNSQSPGVTTCPNSSNPAPCSIDNQPFGAAWTKYQYAGCFKTAEYDPVTDSETCAPGYNGSSDSTPVYSTADKCSNGQDPPNPSEPYLRAGQCNGNIGGIYATCCSNSGGVSLNSCVAVQPFSGAPYPPYDGVCPAGSTKTPCGYGSYPTCGQAACGATTTGDGTPPCDPDWTVTCCNKVHDSLSCPPPTF